MRVLIACEFSGIVRDAFLQRGHDAHSCDVLPSESELLNYGERHFEMPVERLFESTNGPLPFDLLIAHPPCTHLAVSGARWFKGKEREQAMALDFVRYLMALPVPHICIENPISVISSKIRKPDQIIQPWMFGHGEVKATCLWLKNLEKLTPTCEVTGREARVHRMPPSADRWKERSRTLQGIANAMAEQWGSLK